MITVAIVALVTLLAIALVGKQTHIKPSIQYHYRRKDFIMTKAEMTSLMLLAKPLVITILSFRRCTYRNSSITKSKVRIGSMLYTTLTKSL